MSVRPGPEIFESQLQRMLHVLKTGMEYHPANISAAGTRANRPLIMRLGLRNWSGKEPVHLSRVDIGGQVDRLIMRLGLRN